MSENELSQDYIKGFIDALEFVVKNFRGIQINSQEQDKPSGFESSSHKENSSRVIGIQNNLGEKPIDSLSDTQSNSIKDSLDKDYSKANLKDGGITP
jgi:hypothetical protein